MATQKIYFYVNDLPDNVLPSGDLAIDTEAMGLKVIRDRLCLVQICDDLGDVYMVHFPADNYSYDAPNLRSLLLDDRRKKIFHYARFDVAIMKYYLKLQQINGIFCTKIASKLARTYTDRHGLKSVASELLGVDMLKDQGSSNWGANILTEAQKKYAREDVIYLHDIRKKLQAMLEKTSRMEIATGCFDFLNILCDLDILGFEGDLFSH